MHKSMIVFTAYIDQNSPGQSLRGKPDMCGGMTAAISDHFPSLESEIATLPVVAREDFNINPCEIYKRESKLRL